MIFSIKSNYKLAEIDSPGDFGYKRSTYYHSGLDLYCEKDTEIFAIESGIIVNICDFTGSKENAPWWNDTKSILIEGKSGVIGYCELNPTNLKISDKIIEGQLLGYIIPVLKRVKIESIGTSMCHLELYKHGTTDHIDWKLDENKPDNLLNPRELLEKCLNSKQ